MLWIIHYIIYTVHLYFTSSNLNSNILYDVLVSPCPSSGLRYKCPKNYGFSEERNKCWPKKDLPPCQRRLQGAHLRLASAIELYPEELFWFFRKRF